MLLLVFLLSALLLFVLLLFDNCYIIVFCSNFVLTLTIVVFILLNFLFLVRYLDILV